MTMSTIQKHSSLYVAVLFSALLLISVVPSLATAEHHEAPTVTPVELYTCNFLKGKDMDDLDKVTAQWNAWMDENGHNNYLAVTLTPQFNDPALDFEVGWMGGWPSGKAMGDNMHSQTNEGADVLAKFDKVVDCGLHAGFAALAITQPAGPPPETGILQFSDCSITAGKSEEDVVKALNAWGEYQVSQGIPGPAWVMYPVYGGGDTDFDFKYITAHKDYRALGTAFDQIANGGYEKGEEISAGLLECDVSRVYDTRLRRAPAPK